MSLLKTGLGIVPWLALAVAIVSAWFSALTYRVNRRQALDRQSNLIISLDNVWWSRLPKRGRIYELSVLITNRSSSANSLVGVELIITYALLSGHEVRLRLPVWEDSEELSLPIRLDSYQSVARKFTFRLEEGVLAEGVSLKSHTFEFVETAGLAQVVIPKLVSEKRTRNVSEDTKDRVQKQL